MRNASHRRLSANVGLGHLTFTNTILQFLAYRKNLYHICSIDISRSLIVAGGKKERSKKVHHRCSLAKLRQALRKPIRTETPNTVAVPMPI